MLSCFFLFDKFSIRYRELRADEDIESADGVIINPLYIGTTRIPSSTIAPWVMTTMESPGFFEGKFCIFIFKCTKAESGQRTIIYHARIGTFISTSFVFTVVQTCRLALLTPLLWSTRFVYQSHTTC